MNDTGFYMNRVMRIPIVFGSQPLGPIRRTPYKEPAPFRPQAILVEPSPIVSASYEFRKNNDMAALRIVRGFLKSKDWLSRQNAARELGACKDAASVKSLIILAGKDDIPMVRMAAADALGEIGDRSAIRPLREIRKESSGAIKVAIKNALMKLDPLNVGVEEAQR